MTRATVPLVERLRVQAVEALHPDRKVCVWSLDQQVQVVGHEAVREAAPVVPLDRSPQHPHVCPAVVVVEVDQLLPVATSEHVKDPALELLTQSPRHTAQS